MATRRHRQHGRRWHGAVSPIRATVASLRHGVSTTRVFGIGLLSLGFIIIDIFLNRDRYLMTVGLEFLKNYDCFSPSILMS